MPQPSALPLTRIPVPFQVHMLELQQGMPVRNRERGFPGGPVGKNPLADAQDMGLIPGPGRSHMLRDS